MSPRFSLDDIPHLRLPHLPMLPQGHLVIRMHLYAQVPPRVDELHQQRQLAVILPVDSPAENPLRMLPDDRHQIPALPHAIADDALARRHSTHLPAFANRFLRRLQTLIRPELTPTPHHGMQIRFK